MSTKQDRPLLIAGVEYRSRLIIGSGKYKDFEENLAALEASAAEMITVAIRRVNLGQDKDDPACWTSSPLKSTPSCPTPPAVIPPRMLCGPAGWHESSSTATSW